MDNSYKLVAFLEKGNYFKKTEKLIHIFLLQS